MRLKPVRPKDVKNFAQSFKKPQTWFKLFQQLYPLGSGGLREGYTPPEHDFLSDISVGYDYTGSSTGPSSSLDAPGLYSQGGGAEQLKGFPNQTPDVPTYPPYQPQRQPTVPWIPGGYPVDVPIPPIGLPQIWPVAIPGGWPEIPVMPPLIPEYEDPPFESEVWDCKDAELLGGPPCISRGATFQITSKLSHAKSNKLRKKSSQKRNGLTSRIQVPSMVNRRYRYRKRYDYLTSLGF